MSIDVETLAPEIADAAPQLSAQPDSLADTLSDPLIEGGADDSVQMAVGGRRG